MRSEALNFSGVEKARLDSDRRMRAAFVAGGVALVARQARLVTVNDDDGTHAAVSISAPQAA